MQSFSFPRIVKNEAFKRGEKLKYRIHYGFIDAAEATIEISEENRKFNDRSSFHVVGLGKSKGSFDFFFKIRDRYETYIDEEAIVPWLFVRRVDEGGYRILQDYAFNHSISKVNANGRILDIWQNTQDMLSGFYYARTFDFTHALIGDVFSVPTIVDGEMYNLQIKFKGRELIKTDWGKINCLKFVPVLQKGRIFKNEEDMVVWLSDDKNHIPIRAKASILFGSLKMDLVSYSGLKNPFRFQ
ncbi:MAG: DUF3108 domain-containing protein [Chitinophagaceae bacterium]|nr:DUF3108 domain-containing protein [Chitinophagaceae bacterium]HMN33478.1 DUF3108 domain-containing protein [Chitinophagaceae bacterium]